MNLRLVRIALVAIAIAVVSASTYVLKDLDAKIESSRISSDVLRQQAATLKSTIADVRAGQFAYVARGQGETFWMSHVASLLPLLQKQAAEFSSSLTTPVAQAAFEPAMAALENFKTLDARVRELVQGGNSLLAADLIFSDGLESTTNASVQVATALQDELQVRINGAQSLRSRQLAIAGGAAAGVLLLLVAVALAGEGSGKPAEAETAATPVIEPIRFEAPLPKAKPAVTPKLITTAQLCSELSRVVDSRQLSHLLERAARVLDASGIIVWVAEPSRQALMPALSHGYEPRTVARMGSIHRDANNAAAAAYRSAETRTVTGDATTSGAVIVPLMTSEGCVGVLSAELRGGAEKDESSQALASIFAAQLATLVATPAAAMPMKAAAQA